MRHEHSLSYNSFDPQPGVYPYEYLGGPRGSYAGGTHDHPLWLHTWWLGPLIGFLVVPAIVAAGALYRLFT